MESATFVVQKGRGGWQGRGGEEKRDRQCQEVSKQNIVYVVDAKGVKL